MLYCYIILSKSENLIVAVLGDKNGNFKHCKNSIGRKNR